MSDTLKANDKPYRTSTECICRMYWTVLVRCDVAVCMA